jgi:hypothetical protein
MKANELPAVLDHVISNNSREVQAGRPKGIQIDVVGSSATIIEALDGSVARGFPLAQHRAHRTPD